jgi:hypothetical protein
MGSYPRETTLDEHTCIQYTILAHSTIGTLAGFDRETKNRYCNLAEKEEV